MTYFAPNGGLTFNMEGFESPVPVTLAKNISKEQLLEFEAFVTWKNSLKANLDLQKEEDHSFHAAPYSLKSIAIYHVKWFGKKIGFIMMEATITNDIPYSKPLPGVVFLRGGSVAVLMILRPSDSIDERWVVMTEQPRIPAGSLSFLEIPAGMLEKGKSFTGNAANEILEETGLSLEEKDLINLTELAMRNSSSQETILQDAMYPSPGGCDEYIPIFLWEKEMDRQSIENLRGKLTGLRKEGEFITLRVCDYEDLWKEGLRDGKTLAAWALYEALNRAGPIQEEIMKRRKTVTSQSHHEPI
jgi:ADP-sugar diphosphatase